MTRPAITAKTLTHRGTKWGLFQHYWVLIKFVLNLVATGAPLLFLQTLTALADAPTAQDHRRFVHSAAALALLLTATVVSIYKPAGRIRNAPPRG